MVLVKVGCSWKTNIMEVKRQVENVLNVTAEKFGKMELGEPTMVISSVFCAETAVSGLAGNLI
jgi:hypothetical protein